MDAKQKAAKSAAVKLPVRVEDVDWVERRDTMRVITALGPMIAVVKRVR